MKESKTEFPKNFCKEIMMLDKSIRFVAVNDVFAKKLMEEYREGTVPLLSEQDAAVSLLQSTIGVGSKKAMEPQLGAIQYVSVAYEKVKQITVPLNNSYLLFVSFDSERDHEAVVLKKLLPMLKKLRLYNR